MEEPILNAHNKSEYEPAHTAEHILNQTMTRMFGCERSRNAHIERKKSKLNYCLPSCPTDEQIQDIERRVNEVIEADMPVTMQYVTRDNVPAEVSLAKLPDDASATLRLVRVGDYDVCACIGAHVSHTSEIGHFRISSTSWTPAQSDAGTPAPDSPQHPSGTFRIVFRLDGASEKY
jgi:misacylated tRNA(Ala) deacylase